MEIKVEIHTLELLKRCRNAEKRMVYAPVNALNQTIEQMRQAVFSHVRSKFVVRNEGFFFGTPGRPGGIAGKVTFASVGKGRLFAELALGRGNRAVSATQHSVLLPMFEEGGTKRSEFPRASTVAVPLTGSPARHSMRQPVAREYRISNLVFKAFRKGKRRAIPRKTTRSGAVSLFDEFGRRRDLSVFGKVQWKGKLRTFILPGSEAEPHGGIYRRVGPKRGDVRLLYAFRPSVPIDARLDFFATAAQAARMHFRENLERETSKALARGLA